MLSGHLAKHVTSQLAFSCLIVFPFFWAQGLAGAAAAGLPGPSAAAPAVVRCRLDVSGHISKPGVANASLNCQGGNMLVTVDEALEQFQPNFRGVTLEDCELFQSCLISVCGDAHMVFDAPSITGVQLQGFADGG
jgi:hypothetical protein